MSYLESWFAMGFASVVGDPLVAAILFLAVFIVSILLIIRSTDGRIALIVPTFILSMAFVPWFGILIGLFAGVLIYEAIMLIVGR